MNECPNQSITIEGRKKFNFCKSFCFVIDSKDLSDELKNNLYKDEKDQIGYNIKNHVCPFYIQEICTFEDLEPSNEKLFSNKKNYIKK